MTSKWGCNDTDYCRLCQDEEIPQTAQSLVPIFEFPGFLGLDEAKLNKTASEVATKSDRILNVGGDDSLMT